MYNGIVIPGFQLSGSGNGTVPDSADPILKTLFHGLPNTYADWQYNNFVPSHRPCLPVEREDGVPRRLRRFQEPAGGQRSTFLGGNFPFQG